MSTEAWGKYEMRVTLRNTYLYSNKQAIRYSEKGFEWNLTSFEYKEQ